ncbi:photosystem reaction center subunit H [Cohnella sp. CFH 77786]|uniref:PRC-barrel domain-containing protein n=1 Tax=Cohnella sp. CFH 77786 TaxID=2662265 RepID=UPI001C60FFBF|nr:PRC-barrel domain-containing protein [Cohnella sp. CFH 77786]MBW5444996.1 photosystem reaction center subunit H [Cohnella sp. CFH 77786]
MLRIQSLLGLPVLLQSGKKAGEVKDVWFDEFWSMAGIVLDTRVWQRKTFKCIRWRDIDACGEDALIIRDRQAIVKMDKSQMLRSFHGGVVRLKDMPVYTVHGQELGRISDVYFKESEGTPLIGYELTDGFLSDVLEGRRRLLLPEGPEQITLGEDAILVPASYERVLTREHARNAESDR